MNPEVPLSDAMLKALRAMSAGPLFRISSGWMAPNHLFIAHITVCSLRRRGLASLAKYSEEPNGYRVSLTKNGRAAIAVPPG